MKKKQRHIQLAHNEVLITAEESDSEHFKIYFKGKKIVNVIGLIFVKGYKSQK